MISCNGDCFNCPYPDVPDECLSKPLTGQEMDCAEKEEIDRIKQLDIPEKLKRKRIYYWENRDKELEKQRTRRKENLSARRAYDLEHQRKYRAEIKQKYGPEQRKIANSRKRRGWTQKGLADMIGVSEYTVLNWENGHSRANWDLICGVFPELKRNGSKKEAM